ncbi:hypothetical protein ACET70_20820, partial [Aeromonas caviae]|uniref:hypothetical protein n=1 Tax=Aeromonas caviae TaxID=648 RepID=UPI0038D1FD0B
RGQPRSGESRPVSLIYRNKYGVRWERDDAANYADGARHHYLIDPLCGLAMVGACLEDTFRCSIAN